MASGFANTHVSFHQGCLQVANTIVVINLAIKQTCSTVKCENFSGASKQVAHKFHFHISAPKPSTQV